MLRYKLVESESDVVTCDCASGSLDKPYVVSGGWETIDMMAANAPRLDNSTEDAILTYGLLHFLETICLTGQQWGVFLLMSILDIISHNVTSQAHELTFMLAFESCQGRVKVVQVMEGRKFYSPLCVRGFVETVVGGPEWLPRLIQKGPSKYIRPIMEGIESTEFTGMCNE